MGEGKEKGLKWMRIWLNESGDEVGESYRVSVGVWWLNGWLGGCVVYQLRSVFRWKYNVSSDTHPRFW